MMMGSSSDIILAVPPEPSVHDREQSWILYMVFSVPSLARCSSITINSHPQSHCLAYMEWRGVLLVQCFKVFFFLLKVSWQLWRCFFVPPLFHQNWWSFHLRQELKSFILNAILTYHHHCWEAERGRNKYLPFWANLSFCCPLHGKEWNYSGQGSHLFLK